MGVLSWNGVWGPEWRDVRQVAAVFRALSSCPSGSEIVCLMEDNRDCGIGCGTLRMGDCMEGYTGHDSAGGPVEKACKERYHRPGRG